MTTASPSAADLRSSRAAFEAASAAQRLNLLDDLWTSHVQLSDRETLEQDRASLTELVRDMQDLVGDMQVRASELRELVTVLGGETVDRTMDELITAAPNSDQLRADLEGQLARIRRFHLNRCSSPA